MACVVRRIVVGWLFLLLLLGSSSSETQQQQHALPWNIMSGVPHVQALSINPTTSHHTNTKLSHSQLHLVDPQQQQQQQQQQASNTNNNHDNNHDNNDAYFLLTTNPSMWKKFVFTTGALVLLPQLMSKIGLTTTTTTISSSSCHPAGTSSASTIHFLWNNLALPLAASACCALQLGLNLLAVGCAGWNKVLGPLRPSFLALLLVTSLKQQPFPRPVTLLGRTVVALLPELLHVYNTRGTGGATTSNHHNHNHVIVEIPSMGCVACIHSVHGALAQVPGVRSAQAYLHKAPRTGGFAKVVLEDGVHVNKRIIISHKDESSCDTNDEDDTTTIHNDNPQQSKEEHQSSSRSIFQQLTDAVYNAGFEDARVETTASEQNG